MIFKLDDFIKREYEANVARLENIFFEIKKPFELAYFHVNIGEKTTEHNHGEREIFICISGKGKTYIDKQELNITPKDVWFVERNQNHSILNTGDQNLTLISIWWH